MEGRINFGGGGLSCIGDFFTYPIKYIRHSLPEGNRIFEIVLINSANKNIIVTADMIDIDDGDELSYISFESGGYNQDISSCVIEVGDFVSDRFYKVIGKSDGYICECGFLIENGNNKIAIISGSYPYSMHLFSPGYGAEFSILDIQPFSYSFEKMEIR